MITEKNLNLLTETDYSEPAVRKQIADNENKVKEILSRSSAPEARQALSIIKQNDKLLRRKYYLNGYSEEEREKKARRSNASDDRFRAENSGAAVPVAKALNDKYAGKTFEDKYYKLKINKIYYYYGGISVNGTTNWEEYLGDHSLRMPDLRKIDNPELKHLADRIESINDRADRNAERNKYEHRNERDLSDERRQHHLQYKKSLHESVIEENSADAKQKIYNKEILSKLRKKGWEPVAKGSSGYSERYNYVQLRPINRRFIKGSMEERVEVNLRTGKCKLMAMMRNQPEYEEPNTYKYDLPEDVKVLCKQLRHSMQDNFRSAGKTSWGDTLNRTEEMLDRAGKAGEKKPAFKKVIADLNAKGSEIVNQIKELKENGGSEEEIKKLRKQLEEIMTKRAEYQGIFGNNIYKQMMRNGLRHDAEVDKKIALANAKNSSVVTEGSHHAKHLPAINYKCVNNYLIKARKALREGNYDEAQKWAWEAQETMHEDDMQGPGVAADKNAYNIYKKQVDNIYKAVNKAKGY